ncbi:MAG TPA: leucyl aminopeptidase family protein [Thermoanaerobaculia bacterium]|jgi:leucyl aminopeptidase|nr:leucyl aminopeptidase family protein [Thermoanaerobaculia bacterium]
MVENVSLPLAGAEVQASTALLPRLDVVDLSFPPLDLLAAATFEGEPFSSAGLDPSLQAAFARLGARPGFRGADEQRAEGDFAAEGHGLVLSLEGLGPRGEFSDRTLGTWIVRVVEAARTGGAVSLGVVLPEHETTRGTAAAERALVALALGGYRYERYLGSEARKPPVTRIAVLPPAGQEETYRNALAAATAIAAANGYVRDLANSPPNEAGPDWLEAHAAALAAERGFRAEVFHSEELLRRGMGGLLAVGSGGSQPPRLIRLEAGTRGPVVALVGKGVTFDSGGISIKPAADMDEMKFDKSGACAVLGIFRAAIDLDLPVRLRGYLAVAENLLDSAGYRPGDILRCANGKTVEITNTDAEGRLILADALALAAAEAPDALIELSTLTGGCVVALGPFAAGLFSPDDALAAELLAASAASGERIWRLPVGAEYLEEMRGQHADLRNSAGRYGSACTAAAFLSQFVGEVRRWAHLDIAGVVNKSAEEQPQKGATGFGVALVIRWLRDRIAASAA